MPTHPPFQCLAVSVADRKRCGWRVHAWHGTVPADRREKLRARLGLGSAPALAEAEFDGPRTARRPARRIPAVATRRTGHLPGPYRPDRRRPDIEVSAVLAPRGRPAHRRSGCRSRASASRSPNRLREAAVVPRPLAGRSISRSSGASVASRSCNWRRSSAWNRRLPSTCHCMAGALPHRARARLPRDALEAQRAAHEARCGQWHVMKWVCATAGGGGCVHKGH
jgi:hypothetical protein